MSLVKKGTCLRYKFPTSLFVRYGETVTASANTPNSASTYHLNFELNATTKLASSIEKINQVGRKQTDAFSVGANFKLDQNKDVFKKDHDIVLDLVLKDSFKGFQIEDKEDQLVMSSVLLKVPELALAEYPAKEFVLVVDCSGSMGGTRIKDAAKTLQNLVNALPIGSYFNIYKFGNRYNKLFSKSKLLDAKSKAAAIQLCDSLAADMGGTELYSCLHEILGAEKQISQYKRQIFVLTDGGISNQQQTLEMVANKNSENRFFSFGIGSGCSTSLVDGLAKNGKGLASYCGDNESEGYHSRRYGNDDKKKFRDAGYIEAEDDLSAICMKSIMVSAASCISDIVALPAEGLEWPKHELDAICDSSFVSIFHQLGKIDKSSPSITFSQTGSDEVVSLENCKLSETVEKIASPFETGVVRKLLTKKLITKFLSEYAGMDGYNRVESKYFTDIEHNKDAYKKKIIELSVEGNVLCPFTALLAICDDKVLDEQKLTEKIQASQDYEMGGGGVLFGCPQPRAMQLCSVESHMVKSKKKSMGFSFGGAMKSMSRGMPRVSKANVMSFGSPKVMECAMAPPPPPGAAGGPPPPMMKMAMSATLDRSAGPPGPPPAMLSSHRMLHLQSDSSAASSLDEEMSDLSRSTPTPPPATIKPLSSHIQITNSQDPTGFWHQNLPFNHTKHDQEVLVNKLQKLTLTFKKPDQFVEYKPKVINTIYAIILLLAEYSDKCLEWKLSAVKGVAFVRKFIDDFDGDFIVDKCLSEGVLDKLDYDVLDEIF